MIVNRICLMASSLIAACPELECERAIRLAVRIALLVDAIGPEQAWKIMVETETHEDAN